MRPPYTSSPSMVFFPCGGEARVDIPRLHGAHRDAVGPQLVSQPMGGQLFTAALAAE